MKIYICDYESHAGKWIYQGYQKAWSSLGFDIVKCTQGEYPPNSDPNEKYMVMATDYDVHPGNIAIIEKSLKTFLFVQPSNFPEPWGTHPNFISQLDTQTTNLIDQMKNVHLWTFVDTSKNNFYPQWTKKINTIPLAFDSISYVSTEVEEYKQFDVSFVGGWANNGFDEKRKIMINTFSKFQDSGLKCGFFINRNLSHQQECDLLANSKMTINIHDEYQRVLGLDTNERTFKSLGLNGLMISDTVKQLNNLFPDIQTTLDTTELVEMVKKTLSQSEKLIYNIKQNNKENILKNHCYVNRVESLLYL